MDISRIDLADLNDLAESFSELKVVDLVNIKAATETPIPEGSTGSHNPVTEETMREGGDFHTGSWPTHVATVFKNPGRNPSRVPENTPWARTMSQPLHPYGIILNLDIIDFRNIEKIIDEWIAAMKIAATTLDLDKENFIRLIELSLEGSVKIGWQNTPETTKKEILEGESKSTIAERFGKLIKIHFIGDGYFNERNEEKTRENAQALYGLELRNICAVDEYIYWYRKYFFLSGVAADVAAPMFFAKICSPWREMLIQDYKLPEGQMDSVARRMSFLKDKLKDWCRQASVQKNMKKLRGKMKKTPLCCEGNDFPTIIGESKEQRKKRKAFRDLDKSQGKRPAFRNRSWWSKSKARSYKSGQKEGPRRTSSQGSSRPETRTSKRRTFRRAQTRANERFKDCNCYTCGAKGHISPDCPQKKELRRFEETSDISDAVYYGDLVPVYQFTDIPSDESVYEEEVESSLNGSSTESE